VVFISVISEFREFLEEYKVVGLAIAVIIGLAANSLVQALVKDIIMPIALFFIPDGEWQTSTVAIGPIVLAWGDFLAQLINFLILAFVVFMIAKWVLGEQKVTKK
jgi:large conductance mechanosensitive channel